MPAVDLTSPAGGGPASVTPRCSGWSVVSASIRYASIISGTFDAFTEIFTSSKSTSRNRSSSCIADATSASGVMPPCCSAIAGSSEPALTPMRIGSPRSLASRGDELDVLGLADVAGVEAQRLHAGFHRAERELVLEVDVGDDRHRRTGHDLREAFGGFLFVARAAHDVATGGRECVDLRERAVDVGGLRGGHRLDRDRRVAADGNGADHAAGG